MTNAIETEAGTQVTRQAIEWLVRMDRGEPLVTAEKEALREWWDRSALHRQELQRLIKFFNQTELVHLIAGVEADRRKRKKKREGDGEGADHE